MVEGLAVNKRKEQSLGEVGISRGKAHKRYLSDYSRMQLLAQEKPAGAEGAECHSQPCWEQSGAPDEASYLEEAV